MRSDARKKSTEARPTVVAYRHPALGVIFESFAARWCTFPDGVPLAITRDNVEDILDQCTPLTFAEVSHVGS